MPTQYGPRVDHKEEHHCPAVTQYAKSGDVSIAYQVVGEGLPDLVLVSGFLSHVEVSKLVRTWVGPRRRGLLQPELPDIDGRRFHAELVRAVQSWLR